MKFLMIMIMIFWVLALPQAQATQSDANLSSLGVDDVKEYWYHYKKTGKTKSPDNIRQQLTDQASDFLALLLFYSDGRRSLARGPNYSVEIFARDGNKSFHFWTKFIMQISQIGRPLLQYFYQLVIQRKLGANHQHFLKQILLQAIRLHHLDRPQHSIIQQLALSTPDLYQSLINIDLPRLLQLNQHEHYEVLKLHLLIFSLPLEQAPWDLFTRQQLAKYLDLVDRGLDNNLTHLLPWIYRTIAQAFLPSVQDSNQQAEFLSLTPQIKVLLLRLAHLDKYQQPPDPSVHELISRIRALLLELLNTRQTSILTIPQILALAPIIHNDPDLEQKLWQQLGSDWVIDHYGLRPEIPTIPSQWSTCQLAALQAI